MRKALEICWFAIVWLALAAACWGQTQTRNPNVVTGTLNFRPPSAVDTYQIERIETNDSSSADWGTILTIDPADNHVRRFGWNVGADGKLKSDEHYFAWVIEPEYNAPPIQLEQYYTYLSADGLTAFRPFGQTINLSTHSCTTAIRADSFKIGKQDNSLDWVHFQSSIANPLMTLSGSSRLRYSGTSVDWIEGDGNLTLVGSSGTTARFGSSHNVIHFSQEYNSTSQDLLIKIGTTGTGGQLKWTGASTDRWEFSTSAGVFKPLDPLPSNFTFQRVDGTLGLNAGDWAILGNVDNAIGNPRLVTVDVILHQAESATVCQRYVIPWGYAAGSGDPTTWREVQPIASYNTGSVALDVRHGTGQILEVRLRRTATASAGTAFNTVVYTSGPDPWVTSQSTGTGATVSSLFPDMRRPVLETITNDTDGATLTFAEVCGHIYTNTGDADGQTWNLPPVQAGMKVTFLLSAAQDVNVNPDNADQILVVTNAAGDAISSDGGQGHYITLIGIDSTNWMMLGVDGIWTDVN